MIHKPYNYKKVSNYRRGMMVSIVGQDIEKASKAQVDYELKKLFKELGWEDEEHDSEKKVHA